MNRSWPHYTLDLTPSLGFTLALAVLNDDSFVFVNPYFMGKLLAMTLVLLIIQFEKNMQHNIQLISQGTDNFISLKRAKQYLRIDHAYDDEIIVEMIDIALAAAENYLGIKLKNAIWQMTLYDYLPRIIKLQHPPIIKLESIKLYKQNGEELYLGSQHYCLNQFAEQIKLQTHFYAKKAEIIYHTGYEVIWLPAPIRQGMLEHIAKLYDLRGSDHGMPLGVKSLYQPYKRVRF